MPRAHDRHCPHKCRGIFQRKPLWSSSYRNRLARIAPEAEEPPPPPPEGDLLVSGTLDPDTTGIYNEEGEHEGKPTYRGVDSGWLIWHMPYPHVNDYRWYITVELDDFTGGFWYKQTATYQPPTGAFTPIAPATGAAMITAP